jgi:hypothetical protein
MKTTRRTPEGPRVPRSAELKHAFLQRPFQTPHGSEPQTGVCRSGHSHNEGSHVKYRWGPRVGAQPHGEHHTKKGSATLPQLGRTLRGIGNAPTQGQPSDFD